MNFSILLERLQFKNISTIISLTGFFAFRASPRGTTLTVAPSSEDARTCFAAILKNMDLLYKLTIMKHKFYVYAQFIGENGNGFYTLSTLSCEFRVH